MADELLASMREGIAEFEEHFQYAKATKPETITVGVAQQRLKDLIKLKETISQSHNQLNRLKLDAATKEVVKKEYKYFSSNYFDLAGGFQDLINAKYDPPPAGNSQHEMSIADQKPRIKLPPMPLPEFDGSLEKWLNFRDTFESLVHKRDIPIMEKYHYLTTAIKLPAGHANVLNNFPLAESSYEEAWKAVKNRYDDINKLKSQHITNFFTVKRMSGENSAELRRVLDSFSSIITTLKTLGTTYDDFLVHVILFRLEENTVKDWQKHIGKKAQTWEALNEFLTLQWKALDQVPAKKPVRSYESKSTAKAFAVTKSEVAHQKSQVVASSTLSSCVLCKDNHFIYQCGRFREMAVGDRRQFANNHGLCRNCLSTGHVQRQCSSQSRCRKCQGNHHTLLHVDFNSPPSQGVNTQQSSSDQNKNQMKSSSANIPPFEPYKTPTVKHSTEKTSTSMHAVFFGQQSISTLLSTVVAFSQDVRGNWHRIRILLDSGGQMNFATPQLAKKLGLPLINVHSAVTGIHKNITPIQHNAIFMVGSAYGRWEFQVECSILDDITGDLPSELVDTSQMTIPKDVFLADPDFDKPGTIDMLLGSRIYHDSLLNGVIRTSNTPTLVHTRFGWTLGGGYTSPTTSNATLLSCFTQKADSGYEELDEKLSKFLEIENYGTTERVLSKEEKYCEEVFAATTTRDDDGRYTVMLPVNVNIDRLGSNRATAYQRFLYQEKSRQKDEELNKMYIDYMSEYISTGHMTEVNTKGQDVTNQHYLPHHGVKKHMSTTTKLRPVFNASCKSETGLSLNDCLCVGPRVQPESLDILVRFREHRYVLKADIEKMYRQVFLHEEQRKFQKIFWREKPEDSMRVFELNTVTFGVSSAAYLATRTLVQVAIDHSKHFPEASEIIKSSFFVDDFLRSYTTIAEALQSRDQIRYILIRSHMPLRKWSSNHPELVQDLHQSLLDKPENSVIMTLGMCWNQEKDFLTFHIAIKPAEKYTKASVLSEMSTIYDPLGLIGPVILLAKLFMKVLWMLKLSWTDFIPDDTADSWRELTKSLSSLNSLKIPRQSIIDNATKIEVHGFADASETGYGACLYVRSINTSGTIQTSLICSKSRVSPPKQKSIARLELCAATLLSKLVSRIVSILSVNVDEVTLWSDSMITLYWILTSPAKLQTFVANRVSVIQEHTEKFQWRHISGHENPADVISRGLKPTEIAHCTLWWNGPAFFKQHKNAWPESIITINEADDDYSKEFRKSFLIRKQNFLIVLIETRFSKLTKLVNCFSYLRRLSSQTSRGLKGIPTIDEREDALMNIIRLLQQSMFPEEYRYFIRSLDPANQKEDFPIRSTISMLSPFFDRQNQVIRVAGRLQSCQAMSEEQKHPIILPKSHFTKLIIRDLHERHAHPPSNAMLSIVRERFWPLGARSAIKHVQHHCLKCFRVRPQHATQYMGSLPQARVTMTPPFTSTAVDYTGHYNLRAGLTRNSTSIKAYIAMFKCMSTGAIHLEAVTSLSTPAFIAAFDRFVSRRGLCSEIFSDNGTNFVGANNEFKKILSEIEPSIREYCDNKHIRWIFSTPLAPHSGGYYESGIKTVKHHLIRELGNHSYDFEKFSTLLTKIEAIVNSRPLTPLSDDPNDLQVLTPAHFLIGRSLIAKPERNFIPVPENRVDRWNRLQQITQRFWTAWYHDYLHHLQTRPVQFREKNDFHVGDLVLVKDNNLPPMKWLIGRVTRLLPGKDNVVRNVKVQTSKGEKDRHVRYLCFLPIDKSSPSSTGGECVVNHI